MVLDPPVIVGATKLETVVAPAVNVVENVPAPVTFNVLLSDVAPVTFTVEENVAAPLCAEVEESVVAPVTPNVPPTVSFPVIVALANVLAPATNVDEKVPAPVTFKVLPSVVAPVTFTVEENVAAPAANVEDKLNEVPVAAPMIGVIKVGEFANTKAPVPVSSVVAANKFELVGVAKKLAIPVPKPLTPEAIGKPVAFVNVTEVGVPKTGVTKVGLVANTKLPEPVELVVPVPP